MIKTKVDVFFHLDIVVLANCSFYRITGAMVELVTLLYSLAFVLVHSGYIVWH